MPALLVLALYLGVSSHLTAEVDSAVPAPPRPGVPEIDGEPTAPPYAGSRLQADSAEAFQLGVGHLVPCEREPFWVADWVSRVAVPLFDAPGAQPDAWLVGGRLLRDGEQIGFDTSAMVQIGYESLSFVVLELRADGWLRFDLGSAHYWTHGSLLDLGELALVAEPWEEHLQNVDLPPLHFRDRTSRHALRSSPAADAELVTWIGTDHSLEPLAFDGDWMRVRVSQPAAICGRQPEESEVQEGWVKWWGAEKGPWVWYPPRGC